MPKDIVPADAHGPPLGLLDGHVDSFVTSLSGSGYAAVTVGERRQIAVSFAQWTRQRRLLAAHLDGSHVASFLKEKPRRSRSRDAFKRNALRLFFAHLRAEGEVPIPPPPSDQSPMAVLQERYERYLRRERGLAEQSIRTYRSFIRKFLVERVATTGSVCAEALAAQDIRDFLLDRIRKQPTKSSKLLCTALRSFLRFMFLRGETAVDLSLAVPTVRQWRQATVHTFISPEEVEQVLLACDLTTPVGRRDHAVLLLLARLGLRAGEVVALELGDIRWKTGEMLVRGKGRVLERLPLLADIGEALALYLQEDRGQNSSRRVFLRMKAPRVGLTSQTAVGSIARRALARARLRPSRRGAHLFRHSLATTMIRRGASLGEIGEVLRHHSPDTTEVYAKVDFKTLRAVALRWPATGGGR
jgi:integrase/recombinase XerD